MDCVEETSILYSGNVSTSNFFKRMLSSSEERFDSRFEKLANCNETRDRVETVPAAKLIVVLVYTPEANDKTVLNPNKTLLIVSNVMETHFHFERDEICSSISTI